MWMKLLNHTRLLDEHFVAEITRSGNDHLNREDLSVRKEINYLQLGTD